MRDWAQGWAPEGTTTNEAVERDWKRRWAWTHRRARRRRLDRDEELADDPDFKKPLKKHDGLRKHESSLLVQIRTGKVGLNAFLF